MIETKRLLIRYAKLTDIDDMYEYVGDEEVMKYERESYPTKDNYLALLEKIIDYNLLYVITIKDNPKVIGHIYLGKTNPSVNKEYNIGYIINPLYQNKGYCTEAAKAMVDFAFSALHANRVRAACNPENTASWKVMEKIGLLKEGLLKKRFYTEKTVDKKPIFTDELIYGLHISDWEDQLT